MCCPGLTTADLALLGTLGSVLPALEGMGLSERGAAGLDGVQSGWRKGWVRARCRPCAG